MKIKFIIQFTGWIFLTHIFFSNFGYTQFESGPKAVIRPMNFDFGEVIQDSIVTTNFVITNEGGDLLRITKVHASCGCTAVMPEKNELNPGESTNIRVTFNSKGRSGKQTKIITVETNDPNNSILKLTLTGNVISEKISRSKKN